MYSQIVTLYGGRESMGKYDPIGRHLETIRGHRVTLAFSEVEDLLGFALPPSARQHAAWWSNTGGSHVQARAWLDAGYLTESVDLVGERLSFVRRTGTSHTPAAANRNVSVSVRESTQLPIGPRPSSALPRHPLVGALKGMVTIMPGVDLTEPADPEWGKRVYADDAKLGDLVGGLDDG